MNEQSITILVAVGLLVAGWVFKVTYDSRNKNSERLDAIEKQLAAMEFKVTPLWAKVQKQMSDDLHQPHRRYKEMDGLLEKLDNDTLDQYPEDRDRLKELLRERSKDMSKAVSDTQRASAAIFATVMDKVVEEKAIADKADGELVKQELVGEAPPVANSEDKESNGK